MKIKIVSGFRLKNKQIKELEHYFLKQLDKYVKVELKEVNLKTASGSNEQVKTAQSKQIWGALEPISHKIVLTEFGTTLSSNDFANKLDKLSADPSIKLVEFIIGGPYGFDQDYLKKANETLALSPLTFTAEFARLLLIEQIYRGVSINKNLPYHKN